jgi:prepilin-type N-terminal cleavage/methylation domain-containing protein
MLKKGFTLIEMLVVVLIIGILAAIALPQYQYAVFKTRMKEAETYMSTVHNARLLYKLSTGNEATKFEQLEITLPPKCEVYTPALSWGGWQDAMKCNNSFVYGIGASSTTVVISLSGIGDFKHFDKSYPSGLFKCRESDGSSLYVKYCNEMGYPISY